jgi:DNA polymerase III delta subunit
VKDDALRRSLAGTKPPPVVVAVGPESFLREEALATVAEVFLGDKASPDVVVVQPDASVESPGDTAGRFLGEARTGSLFGGRKVAALRDADEVIRAAKASFLAWLASPSSTIVAVLLADELPDDVLAAADKCGVVVRCGGRGGPREFPDAFVRRRASERGKRLGSDEAQMLVERAGPDFESLDHAVEMVSLYAGDAPAITRADVDALFRAAPEGTVWEFGDRLAEGDVAGAMLEASRCFDEGVPEDYSGERVTYDERRIAQKLLSSFTTSVVRALALRRQLDAGVPRGELQFAPPAFKGSLPPRARERVARIAGRRRAEAFEALLVRAEETERGTKSGGADGRLAIARLATMAGSVK